MNRVIETLPGILSWGTLFGLLFLSWKAPFAVAIFIVLYDLFWLLKTTYFFVHLHFSFRKMNENLKIDWLARLKNSGIPWEHVHHVAVFTIYKEPYEVVRASVRSLAEINYPLSNIILVLALEARGGEEDVAIAEKIKSEFEQTFGKVVITVHPGGLPGEIPGKASNEAWSVREVYEREIKNTAIAVHDVLVTVFDADTHPTNGYFGALTSTFLTTPNALRSGYQPVILFANAYEVPIFARLSGFSCTFWGLIQQNRPHRLTTFSCYSLPLQALIDVGFWHPYVIAEDARIFYQCLVHYSGDWKVTPVYYPVMTDAVSGHSFISAARNLYKQQRRWAWGVENVSFLITSSFHNKAFPWKKKIMWILNFFDTFHSWAVSALVIFFFGFLPNVIGGAGFRSSIVSYNLPKITSLIMNISLLGIVISAFLSIRLLSPKRAARGVRWYSPVWYFVQWVAMPFVLVMFSAIPALESQTRLMLGGKFRLSYWVTPKGVLTKENS
ncbi:MAG: glycosyltransferase family 2 protein [Candidatus Paceibacterota bacterium]|jgi:hypothetical protein